MEASLGELEVGADLLGATFPERGGGFRFADALRGGFGGSEGVATCFVELTLALSEDDVVVDEGLGGIVEVGPTLDGELDGVLGAALRVLRVVELGVRQGGAGPSSSKKPAATTRDARRAGRGRNRERRGRARGCGGRAARAGAAVGAEAGAVAATLMSTREALSVPRRAASLEFQDARAGGRRAGADRWSAGGGGMSRGRGGRT